MTNSVARAEFFKLIQYYGERGWIAVERFSDPLRAQLVFHPELNRRRAKSAANAGDGLFITVEADGALRIELGNAVDMSEAGN